ncbi:VOC family protein [Pelagibius litoralis]|uniref:VOC family protein n=1 Tax=Pelagibius litoralis TaxID=374515 RepID=A0A967C2I2_9PROT|nr:VOC family protein [Pelagibius litoralis]NIA67104.1 VOC family protein [Pelagibius litoralis]
MHKSRLTAVVLDCQSDDFERDVQFWGEALGWPAAPLRDGQDPRYRDLKTPSEHPKLLLQQVDHPSRAHIDIETDDIEAEVSRLEALGAKRIAQVKTWWVMEAPSGHRFCVVRPQRADFPGDSREWP